MERRHSRGLLGILVACVVGCSAAGAPMRPTETWPPSGAQRFDRVLLVILENQDFAAVNAHDYFKRLGSRGAVFTRYEGVRHPSYPNYIGLVAGNTRDIPPGLLGDTPTDRSDRSLADLFRDKKLTWKNYAENYPGDAKNCFTGKEAPLYVRRHVPFINFLGVQKDQCANVVAAESVFDKDVQVGSGSGLGFPNFGFYSPNMCHSGHGYLDRQGCGFSELSRKDGLEAAVRWLKEFLDPLLTEPRYATFRERTLMIVTFDESETHSDSNGPTNHTYTVFLGPMVRPGCESARATNHYNVLRTIEENFALGTLGAEDARHGPITDVWTDSPPCP